MDLNKVLAELRVELQRLDAAILSIERLNEGGSRRGRPPKILSELKRSAEKSETEAAPVRRRGRAEPR